MKRVLYILGQLTDSDLEWMINKGSSKSLRSGEYLVEQGAQLEELYIILSGSLEIVNEQNDYVVADIGSGEIIGEMSFIDAKPPSVAVIAKSNCKVYSIPISRMKQRMEVDQGFAARLYFAIALFLSERLRKTTSRLGYGEIQEEVDEIDMNVLSDIGQAGARFTRILQKFSEV